MKRRKDLTPQERESARKRLDMTKIDEIITTIDELEVLEDWHGKAKGIE